MKLVDLLAAINARAPAGSAAIEICAIANDSRDVRPGSLFVAIDGTAADGHDFVAAAIAAGATAVVSERPLALPDGIFGAVVPEGRLAVAQLARSFYGRPDERLGLIGITGTDGKTTTCTLIAKLFAQAGRPCGMITTAELKIGSRLQGRAEHETTPSALGVCQGLAAMASAGDRWAVIEATSHALDQQRVAGLAFDIAAYTRITHEHLEYHGSQAAYVAAKARLAKLVSSSGAVVLNAHDQHTATLSAAASASVITYGRGKGDVRSDEEAYSAAGVEFDLQSPWGTTRVELPLRGPFNVENALAAIAVGGAAGLQLPELASGVESLTGPPGRLQFVDCGQPFAVVVDYAHTPASLGATLHELRRGISGRIIAVFGSAGERDVAKRAMMGQIAARLADLTVVTDEDPRGEDRDAIAADIVKGLTSTDRRARHAVIHSRNDALAYAFEQARSGDVVALLGKGHEKSIIGPNGAQAYDEVATAESLLAGLAANPPAKNRAAAEPQ